MFFESGRAACRRPRYGQATRSCWTISGAHKDAEARALIEAAQARLRPLPPYSPDFNPIEKMRSKVKAFLRQAKARTQEDLCDRIGAAFETVAPNDAEGWFMSCGYTAPQH